MKKISGKGSLLRPETGTAFLIMLAFGLTFVLPAASLSSTAGINDVFLELMTTADDNWTGSSAYEAFNFSVNNTNSSLALAEINISVPLAGDGNASFAVNVSTITCSDAMWDCTNASGDGVGNATLIRCNTSAGNELANGSVISILFYSAASASGGEDVRQWTVGMGNATSSSYGVNLSSGIDGMPPRVSGLSANGTYFNGDILLWATVTDPNLDVSAADIRILNASNGSQQLADPSGESCPSSGGYSFNCSVSWSPSSRGNYSFNITVADIYASSNGSTYSAWFFYDDTDPTIQFVSATTQTSNLTQDYIEANVTANDTFLDMITIFLYNSSSIVNSPMSTTSPFSQNFTSLPDGFYYLNATVNDSGGNAGSTATRTIILDSAPPSITIHMPKNMSYGTGSGIGLNYSAGDNIGLDECWYSLNSASNTTLAGCANATISFSEGFQNITVYANDTTGNLNSATTYFSIDLTAPTVTLISPRSAWDEDGDGLYFYYKPQDAFSAIKNCSLWLSGLSGIGWSLNQTDTTILINQTNDFSVSGMSVNNTLGYGEYFWNVLCFDNASRYAFSSGNYSLYVGDRSNIFVRTISPDKSEIPYVGMAMDVEVIISNNGTENVANTTNVTFCFGTNSANPCDPGTRIAYNNSELIAASDLEVNENHTIVYNITVTGSGGDYYLKVYADAENDEVEQYDGAPPVASVNDNHKIAKFSTNLNVTILEVLNYSVTNRPKPGEKVTINVSVLYDNGSAVTGLLLGNFSINDRWTESYGRNYMSRTENLSIHDFSQNASGVYLLNYTIPDMEDPHVASSYVRRYAEYGLHYVKVGATENNTGIAHSGTSQSDVSPYRMIAPYLRISMNSFNMDPGDPKTYKPFTVYNDGTENFTSMIDLTISRSPTSGMTVGLDDPNVSVSELSDDGYQAMQAWFNPSAENTFTIKLNASTTHRGDIHYYTRIMTVDVENTSTPSDGDEDGDSDQQQQTYECTTNASCSSSKWCRLGYCVSLSCPTGYYASNHVCKLKSVYEVDLTEYPNSVYVLQGGTADINVSVENKGNQDLTAMLEVEHDVDGINVTILPKSLTLPVEDTNNFSIHFDVLANTTIGNHTAKFKVTTSSTAKDTVSFTLVIRPLAETIIEIKADYDEYMKTVEQLLAEFDSIKLSGFVAGENLTLLEAKVNATKLVFDNAKEAMEKEDYILVASLLGEMRTLVNQTRTLMEEMGIASAAGASQFWNTVIMWLVVGIVCIGAVGLLIYMLVPPQGYAMGKGYGAAGRGGVLDKAKSFFSSLKNKFTGIRGGGGPATTATQIIRRTNPAYKSGYSKLGPGYRPEPAGIKDKMKKLIGKE